MKKLFALLLALTLALLALTTVLAEAAEELPAAPEEVSEAAEVAEDAAGGFPLLEKLASVRWYVWVVVAALAAAGVLLAMNVNKTLWNSRRLAIGAMCLAISFVLNCMPLFRLPQGGLITPASLLPIIMFMLACGPLQGFVVGCAFGLLMLIADPFVVHPVQLLVDYPLAYGAMILGCVAAALPIDRRWKLPLAVLLAGVGRYVMAVLSGAIFFAEYAGEQNAWVYSLVYNITYIGPDVLVCMLVACIPGMPRLVDTIKKKN